jgi:hypothetical protein
MGFLNKIVVLMLVMNSIVSAQVVKLDLQGILDIVIFEGSPVYLNQHGDVYIAKEGTFARMNVPDRMIQLATGHNSLYLLREDGSVWQHNQQGLKLLERDLPTRQMLVYGNRLYLLRNMGALSCIENGRPRMLLTGHQYTTMSRAGNQIFLTDGWGRVYRYDTYVDFLEMIDPTPDTVQIASADSVLFSLKKNGKVFKYEDMQFYPLVYDSRITNIETNGQYLYFSNQAGQIYELNLAVERMDTLNVEIQPEFMRWIDDRLYISEKGGYLYEYKPLARRHRIQVNFHRLYSPTIQPMRHGFGNTRGF